MMICSLPAMNVTCFTGSGQYRKGILPFAAAPVKDNAQNALKNISIITGSDRVFKYPFSGNLESAYLVTLDVHQFDGRQGEAAYLNVSRALKKNQATPDQQIFKKTVINQPVSEKGYEALVKAQSEAINTLSREIAGAIKKDFDPQ